MTHDEQPHPLTPGPTSLCDITGVAVWHTSPPDQPGSLTADLARRLLDDHTRPGQFVIDLDDEPALPGVAAATGRGHHALGGHSDPEEIARHSGHVDLVVLRWPRPATNPRHLLQTAHTLLKATGLLAIVVHVPVTKRAAHLVALTGAAHSAGFRLQRHVVAIAVSDDPSVAPPTEGGRVHPHSDLLVFQSLRTS